MIFSYLLQGLPHQQAGHCHRLRPARAVAGIQEEGDAGDATTTATGRGQGEEGKGKEDVMRGGRLLVPMEIILETCTSDRTNDE